MHVRPTQLNLAKMAISARQENNATVMVLAEEVLQLFVLMTILATDPTVAIWPMDNASYKAVFLLTMMWLISVALINFALIFV